MKPLSEQLADLSVRAKKAEDDAAAARTEAHAAIQARVDQLRADATARADRVDAADTAALDSVAAHWTALHKHVKDRVATINSDIAATKAEQKAELAEDNAADAIAFAYDSIDYAESPVLDAILARSDADTVQ